MLRFPVAYLHGMRWPSNGAAVGDVVLAAAVPALFVAQVAAGDIQGPLWVGVVGGLVLGVAVLWRRAHPWAALIVVFTAIVATSLLGLSQQGLYGAMLAGFVVVYELACDVPLRQSFIGFAFGLIMIFASAHRSGLWKFSFAVFVLGGALVIGSAVRSHWRLAEQLRSAMEELTARRDEVVQAAVATEKVQIARELHDVIAHAVSVMVIQASAAEGMLDVEADRARRPLSAVQESGRQALGELRRLLAVLRPDDLAVTSLSPQPGLSDLDALADPLRAAGLSVDIRLEGTARTLPAGVDLAAYRIVQEALTNVLKHANAQQANVAVRYGADRIDLEVTDDGCGATMTRIAGDRRHGLIGMRERASAYRGELHAGPRGDRGYLVRATLEIPNDR